MSSSTCNSLDEHKNMNRLNTRNRMHKLFARVWGHGICYLLIGRLKVATCRHRYCVQKAYLNCHAQWNKNTTFKSTILVALVMAESQFGGALIFPWQRCCFSVSRGIVLWATVTLMLDSEHNTAPACSDDLHPELHEVFTSEAICAEERV